MASTQADDITYIATLKARGVSTQGIAQMTGLGTDAVRLALSLLAPLPQEQPVVRDIIWVTKRSGRKIATDIAQQYGLTFADLESPSRKRDVAHPRQHVMWMLRQTTVLSLPQIGRLLGGRDHTTVIHGIRAYEARLDARRVAA